MKRILFLTCLVGFVLAGCTESAPKLEISYEGYEQVMVGSHPAAMGELIIMSKEREDLAIRNITLNERFIPFQVIHCPTCGSDLPKIKHSLEPIRQDPNFREEVSDVMFWGSKQKNYIGMYHVFSIPLDKRLEVHNRFSETRLWTTLIPIFVKDTLRYGDVVKIPLSTFLSQRDSINFSGIPLSAMVETNRGTVEVEFVPE